MSRISKVVVWQFMCDDFGDFEMMNAQCVHPTERVSIALWEFRGFWERDIGE